MSIAVRKNQTFGIGSFNQWGKLQSMGIYSVSNEVGEWFYCQNKVKTVTLLCIGNMYEIVVKNNNQASKRVR